jgi:hypothetical protein
VSIVDVILLSNRLYSQIMYSRKIVYLVDNVLRWLWQEVGWPIARYYPDSCVEEPRESTKYLRVSGLRAESWSKDLSNTNSAVTYSTLTLATDGSSRGLFLFYYRNISLGKTPKYVAVERINLWPHEHGARLHVTTSLSVPVMTSWHAYKNFLSWRPIGRQHFIATRTART